MLTTHTKSKYRPHGNLIINLSVLLCNTNIITPQSCDSNNDTNLPSSWPCQWNDGEIPFVFDFFTLNPKKLMTIVHKAHSYIEDRSCLVFKERNPVESARKENFTYLFYSYSEVLEDCCLPFYTKSVGRRLILITPVCALASEVVHATLHGLGLNHPKYSTFIDSQTRSVLFSHQCENIVNKIDRFNENRL